jgi:hypothetical protein
MFKKVNVLNLNDKVKILDLLKGSMFSAEAGQHCREMKQVRAAEG